MMAPGVDHGIQERWDLLWQWLQSRKKTRADQTKRLEQIKQLLKDELEGPSSPSRLTRIQTLRKDCQSPFVAHPRAQLFACRSNNGLIFLYDCPVAIKAARQKSNVMTLYALGVEETGDQEFEMAVFDPAPLPVDQILPWAEAAAIRGHEYLYTLCPHTFMGSIPGPGNAG